MREFETTRDMVMRHEGLRLDLYRCTGGFQTIGYGHNIEAKGITQDIAERLLDQDLKDAEEITKEFVPYYKNLTYVRQAVLIDMALNMGRGMFVGKNAFKKMLKALKKKDYEGAADEMEDSLWCTQTGDRSIELIKDMRNG